MLFDEPQRDVAIASLAGKSLFAPWLIDAAYLQLAVELNARLATFDRTLAEAARRVLGGG